MMVAPLIPIALALAQFAPQLMRFMGAGETSTNVAEKIADVAMTVSGAKSPADALIAIRASAELQAQFAQRTLELDHAMEQAYLADVQDARKRDTAIRVAGGKNYRPDVMFVLAVIVTTGLVFLIWRSADLNEYVKGIFTLVLGRFLGYLDNIYNFEFGSTRSNKSKDVAIEQLTRKD